MARSPSVEAVERLLAEAGAGADFAAALTVPPEDLQIDVQGVGTIALPLDEARARELCEAARPARYGQGEETLLDRSVRDTWKIPPERVRVDEARWAPTLRAALDTLGQRLGLGEGPRLVPELHALLIYETGQFFLPHRDSEKSDGMVATLTVTLPSRHTGGELVVEHAGESRTFRGSKDDLSLVAFYADCRHEARPVETGCRVVLTYDLRLAGAEPEPGLEADAVEALAGHLRTYFETPLPSRWEHRTDAADREPPDRLAFLLDHQYTPSGLSWNRLKGRDRLRTRLLRAASARADCEVVLALAEIQETWTCFEEDRGRGYDRGRHRRWTRIDGEWVEDEAEPAAPAGPEQYEPVDLQGSSVALTEWLEPDGADLSPAQTYLERAETCAATPTSDLEAYTSEYHGYMGNWGNTMDRWYRRAAVVLWPRKRRVAVRTDAAPGWTVDTLLERLRDGRVREAREIVRAALPVWKGALVGETGRKLFGRVLRVAEGLRDEELARELLDPPGLTPLTPDLAPDFAALVARYGEPWADALLARWSASANPMRFAGDGDPFDWTARIPALCEALIRADRSFGWSAACLLLRDRWEWLENELRRAAGVERPSDRRNRLARLSAPLLGLLEGAGLTGEDDVRDEAVEFLCADENEVLLPCLLQTLRDAAAGEGAGAEAPVALDRLGERAAEWLRRRLSLPARAEDDWSMTLPAGCDCELCQRLEDFLDRSDRQQLEWPIAKEKRKHVHRRIDHAELPVDHRTRRTGSPYTLVLTKRPELFQREAAEREAWREALEWLEASGYGGGASDPARAGGPAPG